MKLNDLSPAEGSRKKRVRVGRGIGSGLGKTCGRGHKGQYARKGGYHKVGFEGGQMPLQRRLPKFGFNSLSDDKTANLRLSDINVLDTQEVITIGFLKQNNVIEPTVKKVKLYASGSINKAIKIQGILVTKGAAKTILDNGGEILS